MSVFNSPPTAPLPQPLGPGDSPTFNDITLTALAASPGLVTATGTGLLTSTGIAPATVVTTTGTQTISGPKTFSSVITAAGGVQLPASTSISLNYTAPAATVSIPVPTTFGQATSLALPDPGAAAAQFLLTPSTIPAMLPVVSDSKGNLVSQFPSIVPLPLSTTSTVRVFQTMGAGNNNVYTVPAGFYGQIVALTIYNAAGVGNTVNIFASPDAGVTTYFISIGNVNSVSVTAFAVNTFTFQPGDTIVINNTQATQTLGMTIVLFASTGTIRAVTRRVIAAGDTTLYTCPASTKAYMLGTLPTETFEQAVPRVLQSSGGGVTYTLSANISATQYIVGKIASTTGSVALLQLTGIGFLTAGDSWILNASGAGGAGSHCWFNLIEYPASVL